MDKDRNGHLSVTELREGYNGRCMFELFMDHKHNHDDPEEDFEILMQELDLDKDGELDYQEFLYGAVNHQILLNKQNIEEIFKMFDHDGDGFLSKAELRQSFSTSSMTPGAFEGEEYI